MNSKITNSIVIGKYRHLLNDVRIFTMGVLLQHPKMHTDDWYGDAVITKMFGDIVKYVTQNDVSDVNKFGVSSSLRQVFKLVSEENESIFNNDVASLSPQLNGILLKRPVTGKPDAVVWYWKHGNLKEQVQAMHCFRDTLGIDPGEFFKFFETANQMDYLNNILMGVVGMRSGE